MEKFVYFKLGCVLFYHLLFLKGEHGFARLSVTLEGARWVDRDRQGI